MTHSCKGLCQIKQASDIYQKRKLLHLLKLIGQIVDAAVYRYYYRLHLAIYNNKGSFFNAPGNRVVVAYKLVFTKRFKVACKVRMVREMDDKFSFFFFYFNVAVNFVGVFASVGFQI